MPTGLRIGLVGSIATVAAFALIAGAAGAPARAGRTSGRRATAGGSLRVTVPSGVRSVETKPGYIPIDVTVAGTFPEPSSVNGGPATDTSYTLFVAVPPDGTQCRSGSPIRNSQNEQIFSEGGPAGQSFSVGPFPIANAEVVLPLRDTRPRSYPVCAWLVAATSDQGTVKLFDEARFSARDPEGTEHISVPSRLHARRPFTITTNVWTEHARDSVLETVVALAGISPDCSTLLVGYSPLVRHRWGIPPATHTVRRLRMSISHRGRYRICAQLGQWVTVSKVIQVS